jgi:hypothetical protein
MGGTMVDINKAVENQIKNIQARSGKSLDELFAIFTLSGLKKHGEVRSLFIKELSLGYGDASTLASHFLQSNGVATGKVESVNPDLAVSDIYNGPKAALRPIHDEVMNYINSLGPFEIAPKKGYLSLRRKRQFAMVGPVTNSRIEVGLNMKGITPTNRLEQNPPGGMCQYKVKVTSLAEVDAELKAWINIAFNSAN